jgi:hypothetical protein
MNFSYTTRTATRTEVASGKSDHMLCTSRIYNLRRRGQVTCLVGSAGNEVMVGVALQTESDGAGCNPVCVPAVLRLHLFPPIAAKQYHSVSLAEAESRTGREWLVRLTRLALDTRRLLCL